MADEPTAGEANSLGMTVGSRGNTAGLAGMALVILVLAAIAGIWWSTRNDASEAEARSKIAALGAFITPGAQDQPVHSINLSMVKNKENLDTVVAQLPAFGKLKNIDARGAPLDDDHLAIIGQLDSLIGLTVTETNVTDEGMKHLTGLGNIINLTLYGTNVGNQGLKEIGKLKSVKILNIANTRISGDLSEISGLIHLEWLVASGLNLSDAAADTLAQLENLSHLTIQGTKISEQAIQAILKKKPDIGVDR
ncbi:MAG: hypothetical protein JW829_12225 [Pirellulales bacterium]|nr:hypothetical protein [Pirellulales bacterium]